MHSRISRLFGRAGSPAENSYVDFHFDEAAVTPQRRIQKSPVTIPHSWLIRSVKNVPHGGNIAGKADGVWLPVHILAGDMWAYVKLY